MEEYKNIMGKYKVATSRWIWDKKLQKTATIDEDAYDIIVNCVGEGYYCKLYEVIKNEPKLSEQELALICDEGNLCFGYDIRDGRIAVYTD